MSLGGIVSLNDYRSADPGFGAFGISTRQDVEELNKALTVGNQSPRMDGGNVMRVESLEQTMRILIFSEQHLKLMRRLGKRPAYSTVEEYNLQTSYGGRGKPWIREQETPQAQDASYLRRAAYVKFLGTTRGVSHVATLVKPAHGPLVALETKNGAIWLMAATEQACFSGRSDVVPEAFDGIFKLTLDDPTARKKNIIDCRGGIITPDLVDLAAQIITDATGVPNYMTLATRAQSDLGKQYLSKERVPAGAGSGRVGQVVREIDTVAGIIPLEASLFVRSGKEDDLSRTFPTSATAPRAPAAPTLALAANAGPISTGGDDGKGSQFGVGDVGTFRYVVTALNRFGESAASAEQSASIAAKGDAITLTITDGGGTDGATGYRIYRSLVGGAANSEIFMWEVPRVGAAATTAYQDLNEYLPGTSQAYMLQNNLEALAWVQLAPMMKIALGTSGPNINWMQLLYGVLIDYAPRKHVVFKNVQDG